MFARRKVFYVQKINFGHVVVRYVRAESVVVRYVRAESLDNCWGRAKFSGVVAVS